MNIREYLKDHRVITDGAMGTYFDEIDQSHMLCSEEANILEPEMILRIHESYLENGANLIRTNTFAANHATVEDVVLKNPMRKASFTVESLIRSGWNIAMEAVGEAEKKGHPAFVAADIGPIPENAESKEEEILKEYYHICDIFLQEGAEIFVFETFPDETYVLAMAEYIRKKCQKAFLIGQYVFIPSGYSRTGRYYQSVIKRSIESGLLDCVGMNCGIGAAHMEKFYKDYFTKYDYPKAVYLSALPNRGYPKIVRGKAVYSDSASYFGQKMMEIAELGVSVIGGCCGTTPEYIHEIADRYDKLPQSRKTGRHLVIKVTASASTVKEKAVEETKAEEDLLTRARRFRQKLERGEKVWAVEVDPPFDGNVEKLTGGVKLLRNSKADVVTMADSPLARSRADSLLTASRIQAVTGMPVMPHIACRDRNRIAMRSGLLGAHINDIRNIFIITGDPVGRDERDFTKSVFDYNSIKLMQYVKSMNEDVFEGDPFFYGGALNQGGLNPDKIADRMKRKMESGCGYFMTQPVYSQEGMERLAYLQNKTGAKILIGIMPLVSRRNALFIQNEMPGIYVPDSIVNRYREDADRKEWEEVAIEICTEMFQAGEDIGAGYYLITPFNRVALMKRLMDRFKA